MQGPPAPKGTVKIIGKLCEIVVDPLVRVPGRAPQLQVGVKVLDDTLECRLQRREGRRRNLEAGANRFRERHACRIPVEEHQQRRRSPDLRFESRQTNLGDGQCIQVG